MTNIIQGQLNPNVNLPRILVTVNNKKIVALLDLGASISCISANSMAIPDTKKSKIRVIGADGSPLESGKECNLELRVTHSLQFRGTFQIVQNLNIPVIIGTDIIDSLTWDKTDPFVVINGPRIKRYDPINTGITGRVYDPVTLHILGSVKHEMWRFRQFPILQIFQGIIIGIFRLKVQSTRTTNTSLSSV